MKTAQMTNQIGSREDLAWAAGVFDGEGHFGCTSRKLPGGRMNPQIRCIVVQWHDRELTDRFHAAVGGIGTVSQRLRNDGESTEYTWRTQSFEGAQAVAAMIWPWLGRVKRAQWSRVRDQFLNIREVQGTREWRRRNK